MFKYVKFEYVTIFLLFINSLQLSASNVVDLAMMRTLDDPVIIEEEKEEQVAKIIVTPDQKDFINKIKKVQSLSANFVQYEKDPVKASNNKTIKGYLKLSKPNKLLWEINSPSKEQQSYVTNGSKFWHYDKTLEQVVVDDFDSKRISNSPLYFLLANIDNLPEQYNVKKLANNNFLLTVKNSNNLDNNYISDLKLQFNQRTDMLEKLDFIAAKNKNIIIELDNISINSVGNSSFNFNIPRGVDVINADELYQ